MNARSGRLAAWSLAALSLLLLGGSLVINWQGRASDGLIDPSFSASGRSILALGHAVIPLLGGLIASRQPRNSYGWVWLSLGFAFSLMAFAQAYAIQAMVIAPGTLPLGGLMLVISGMAWFLSFSILPLILMLFPTGHLASRRWRLLVGLLLAAVLIGLSVGWAIPNQAMVPAPNPYALEGSLAVAVDLILNVAVLLVLGIFVVSAVGLVGRYRRASGIERQQFKWFAFGAATFATYLVSDFFFELPGNWESVKEALAFALLPVTIGISILRYRLYDIDLLIRRTLIYGALTALLALVYFGGVLSIQSLFNALAGRQSPISIVISTLAIAALFTPLRRRVQGFVDRRFYRGKYDAERTLASFATTARDEVEFQRLTEALLQAVHETIQPSTISLWLDRGSPSEPESSGGQLR